MTEIKDSCLWKIWKTPATPFHAHSPVHRSFGQDMTQFKVKTSRWGTECDMMGLGGLPSYGHPQFLHVEFPKLMNLGSEIARNIWPDLVFARSDAENSANQSQLLFVGCPKNIKQLQNSSNIEMELTSTSWFKAGDFHSHAACILSSTRGEGWSHGACVSFVDEAPRGLWSEMVVDRAILHGSDMLRWYFIIFYPCGLWIFVTRLVFFRTITLLSYPWFILLAVILDISARSWSMSFPCRAVGSSWFIFHCQSHDITAYSIW